MLPGALIVTDEPVRYTPSPEVEPQVEMAVDPRAARDSLGQQTLYANAPGKEAEVVLGDVHPLMGEGRGHVRVRVGSVRIGTQPDHSSDLRRHPAPLGPWLSSEEDGRTRRDGRADIEIDVVPEREMDGGEYRKHVELTRARTGATDVLTPCRYSRATPMGRTSCSSVPRPSEALRTIEVPTAATSRPASPAP